jgi:hypothetical protein
MSLNRCCFAATSVVVMVLFSGCGPTAQDLYDEAARQMKLQQERLDNLRPAYDAARQKTMLAVTKELAGATPDENAQNALQQLDEHSASVGATDLLAGTNQDQLDAAVEHLTKMQSVIESQQGVLLSGAAKIQETMKNIDTPGTAEHKRFEEMLGAMPEVQAYRRQEQRLNEAKETLAEAEKVLAESEK